MSINLIKKITNLRSYSNLAKISIFMVGFAAIGGGVMLFKSSAAITFVSDPQHRAACVQNTPSKTYVKPGSSFSAVVQMKNTGTSTWGPGWGWFLSEYSTTATSGILNWNASGATISRNYLPGETATFNLSLKAPSTPGSYSFNWGMHIVFVGFVRDPCTGKTVTVKNPPVVTLNANNQSNNISVVQGSSLVLNWSSTNGATSCVASGGWSGAKSTSSSSENRTIDTATVGTKSYTLTCSNQVGTNSFSTKTRNVTVTTPPTPPATTPTPTPSSPPPSSTSTPSSPAPSSPTSPGASGSSNPSPNQNSPVSIVPDTTPPTTPENFIANYIDSVVDLSWNSSQDSNGILGYELERSTDSVNWQKLTTETISDEIFTDTDVNFDTLYYYRLLAVDIAGNSSGNITTEVTTGGFVPNTQADQDLVLTSDDGTTKVTIPSGAFEEEASCDLRPSQFLYPNLKDYSSVTGPYELLCKQNSGNKVSTFLKPVTVQITLSKDQSKQFASYRYFTYNEEWLEVDVPKGEFNFVLGDSTNFAIMGQIKKTPLWQKLLIILIILAVIIGGGITGLRLFYKWKLGRSLAQQNQDNYNKEHGY